MAFLAKFHSLQSLLILNREINSNPVLMRRISPLLAFLLLLQSCNVYHPERLTIAEAVAANNKVKVITADDRKLKFQRLEWENEQLIGVATRNSMSGGKLKGMSAQAQGDLLLVDLSQGNIEEIRRRNNTLSTVLSIVVPAVTAAAAILIVAFYIGMSQDDFSFGSK